jgi:hypothetical protein
MGTDKTGVFGKAQRELPAGEWVDLESAISWLAFGDSFTHERWQEEVKLLDMPNSQIAAMSGMDNDAYKKHLDAKSYKVWCVLSEKASVGEIALRGQPRISLNNLGEIQDISSLYFMSGVSSFNFLVMHENETSVIGRQPSPNTIIDNSDQFDHPLRVEYANTKIAQSDVDLLLTFLEQSDESAGSHPSPNKRGPKHKYKWDEFEAHLCGLLDRIKEPSPDDTGKWRTQADVKNVMEDWCEKNWDKTPEDTSLRDHIRKIIKEWKRQKSK